MSTIKSIVHCSTLTHSSNSKVGGGDGRHMLQRIGCNSWWRENPIVIIINKPKSECLSPRHNTWHMTLKRNEANYFMHLDVCHSTRITDEVWARLSTICTGIILQQWGERGFFWISFLFCRRNEEVQGDHTLPAELVYHTISVRPRTSCRDLVYYSSKSAPPLP